ncbi:MAG: tRNA uridine-5-carboxymethylaminomethyl(34) synthesis GTPase MnmE [Clostridia bacterium]|nr:tRNA uridine-5-carboxymethylaminomethyl(34) synthesis GTPase MnmE [Clostridia bacterium]
MQNENIAALSTGNVASGVAVIRISGSSPLAVAEKMFRPTGKTAVKDFKPNVMYVGEIEADGFSDFGMCVYFRAPLSFTGEDTVEFHSHGGIAITQGILRKIFSLGVRPATNGEFTKRAFMNGKLSLSSAEGLIDMINSESQSGVRAGYYLYREKLLKQVSDVQESLTDLLSQIDVDMDFPEEDLEADYTLSAKAVLTECIDRLNALIGTYRVGRVLKNGVNVGIIGKPNTGKSSTLNALLNYDKAIVSSVAGTTRDVVEGVIEINGVRFNLSDTAGIRDSEDLIEGIGVELSKKIVGSSDLLLFIIDGSNYDGYDEAVFKLIEGKNALVVVNKTDVSDFKHPKADLYISALKKENIDSLREMLYARSVGGGVDLSGDFLCEERHFDALTRAKDKLVTALNALGTVSLDMVAIDIKDGWDALGEISGKTATEEIINNIFAKFCVGK